MAYVFHNENPMNRDEIDCIVRAVALATDTDWDTAFIALSVRAYIRKRVINSDRLWWGFLADHGFEYHAILHECPRCVTVEEFCYNHPEGLYVLATQNHVLTAIDGDWYDTFDSGGETVLHYWTRKGENYL